MFRLSACRKTQFPLLRELGFKHERMMEKRQRERKAEVALATKSVALKSFDPVFFAAFTNKID